MTVSAPPRAPRQRSSDACSGARGNSPRPPGRTRRQQRPPDPRLRLQAVLIVVLMVLSVIAGRLIQLQGLDRSTYSVLAQDQRLQTVTLTAPRGSITDRSGQPIAETVDARDVTADPTQVTDVPGTAAALAPLLRVPVDTLEQKLSVHSRYALLAPPVTPAIGNQVDALRLPGIITVDTTKRVYPDGSLASNVVGVVGADGKGLGGLELSAQSSLAGRDGKRVYEAGVGGTPIPDGRNVLQAPVSGTGLRLSLDSDLQFYAQQQIAAQVRKTRASSGTVIVMNPANGQVLALAVAPGFDPNHLASAKPADLGDPAITDPYEPGSVNKVITMSAGLEDGFVTPTSPFVIPPSLTYDGTTFRDAESHGTEHLTLTGILAQSSNIGAIEVAKKLGSKRMDDYLRAYGFGATTGLGLPGESAGILPPLADWSGTTLPTLSFGQGIAVTAIQVASVYSTIANGGVRVTPNVIESTIDSQGHLHPAGAPTKRRVISAHVAAELRAMMESVISPQGTAPEARIAGYTVAGKTGTADRSNGHGGYSGYTASFVGMVPAEHPQLVCEVVLQQPKTNHFGGSVAGPVFHNVMSFALQTFSVAPTGTRLPHIPLTW